MAASDLRGVLFRCGILGLIALQSACNKPAKTAGEAAPKPVGQSVPAEAGTGVSGQVSAAQNMVKQGSLDLAAAELVRIQSTTKDFTPAEASAYRQALEEAHSKALEAAAKGDPKAQAALQILRASRPQ